MIDPDLSPEAPRDDTRAALAALRDTLRSARRWRDLLSEDDRRRLLADIASVALAIGRDLNPEKSLEDLDIGDGATGSPCPRERLAFLEREWPRLSSALRRLEAMPPARLVAETRIVPAERARRVSPQSVLQALRRGDLTSVTASAASATPLAKRLGGRLPRRVTEAGLRASADTPENRAVKGMLTLWSRDLAAITALAEVSGVPDVARAAAHLRARIRDGHLCRDPWRSLPPAAPLHPTLLHSGDGAYRLLLDAWRRYRRGFAFDWSNPLFALPPRETWLLHEYWCLFQVAGVLRELGWRCREAEGFTLLRSGLTFSLAHGAASRLTFTRAAGERITLIYSRRFARAEETASGRGGWYSRSHALTPDITLEYAGRLLIFDAKFKTYTEGAGAACRFSESALIADIQQMHSYRDAIRRGESEDRVVRGAWLLYAGRGEGPRPPIVAYPRSTNDRPFGNGDVGALLLRPGNCDTALTKRIAHFIHEVGMERIRL